MATNAQPMPGQADQGGAPPAGAGTPPPTDQGAAPQDGVPPTPPGTQAPANPLQMLLARWYQVAKQMAAADPRLASGAEKISQGIQEMQTALVTPPQPTPIGQQPMY